jgi:hypothetical protein
MNWSINNGSIASACTEKKPKNRRVKQRLGKVAMPFKRENRPSMKTLHGSKCPALPKKSVIYGAKVYTKKQSTPDIQQIKSKIVQAADEKMLESSKKKTLVLL